MKKRCITIFLIAVLFIPVASAWSAENCKTCHADTYQKWNVSKHAESLNAAGGNVLNIESCKECHLEAAIKDKWGRKDIETVLEPITCEICHAPPEGGYETHTSNPAGAKPEVNLSAEMCGSCHTDEHHPTIDEWDEFNIKGFDSQNLSSHSEPTDVLESYVTQRQTCMSCKSTDSAIFNLQDPEVYEFNEDKLPEPSEIKEWRITCAACHNPHTTGLRIEDKTKLCANCHNGEKPEPDGATPEAHHPQWEMFEGSGFMSGEHPVNLDCSDCHMVRMAYNDTTHAAALTGHSFDFNPEMLSSSGSENGCYECHASDLQDAVETKQKSIETKLEELLTLKETAAAALEQMNGTKRYAQQKADYNNGLFYLSMVEQDGSSGIHNSEKAATYLGKSETLLNGVIEAGSKPRKQPGFGAIFAFVGLIAVFYFLRRK